MRQLADAFIPKSTVSLLCTWAALVALVGTKPLSVVVFIFLLPCLIKQSFGTLGLGRNLCLFPSGPAERMCPVLCRVGRGSSAAACQQTVCLDWRIKLSQVIQILTATSFRPKLTFRFASQRLLPNALQCHRLCETVRPRKL